MVRRPARTAVRVRHPRIVLSAGHGGRRRMSISGHGDGTAGPALHAYVLAGLAMIWWIPGEAREALESARSGRRSEDD